MIVRHYNPEQGSICSQYTHMWKGWQPQNTLAASYQTCNLALLVQFGSYQMKKMKKRITLWYSEMLTLSNLSSNPGSPNSTGFCYGAKVSARRAHTSALPLAFEPSAQQARKGICRSQVKARLASRVDFTHTHIYLHTHIYIYINIHRRWRTHTHKLYQSG